MPRYQNNRGDSTARMVLRAVLITLLAVVCLVAGWTLGSIRPLPLVTELLGEETAGDRRDP